MKILLICAAGMSTSLLVTKMQKFAQEEDSIEALSETEFYERYNGIDVVLVGPQLRHRFKEVKQFCEKNNIAAGLLDMVTFGIMDGEAAYKQAINIYDSSKSK